MKDTNELSKEQIHGLAVDLTAALNGFSSLFIKQAPVSQFDSKDMVGVGIMIEILAERSKKMTDELEKFINKMDGVKS